MKLKSKRSQLLEASRTITSCLKVSSKYHQERLEIIKQQIDDLRDKLLLQKMKANGRPINERGEKVWEEVKNIDESLVIASAKETIVKILSSTEVTNIERNNFQRMRTVLQKIS